MKLRFLPKLAMLGIACGLLAACPRSGPGPADRDGVVYAVEMPDKSVAAIWRGTINSANSYFCYMRPDGTTAPTERRRRISAERTLDELIGKGGKQVPPLKKYNGVCPPWSG